MYYPDILKQSVLIDKLRIYGFDKTLQKELFEPILTSYFYLQGQTTTDKTVDFIHKSFQEYLLAEYYIESILEDKKNYLNVGIPTAETMLFLDGLLELFNTNNNSLNEYTTTLIKSLVPQNQQQNVSPSQIKRNLIRNAQRYYEDEEIIFQTENSEVKKIGLWNMCELPLSRYRELWIHRWLSLYVLNKLEEYRMNIDKKILSDLIVKTSRTVSLLPKRLRAVDLSFEFLQGADLSNADLSGANLSGANLSGANLSGADIRANLSGANLSGADLSNADLSGANLSGANLSGANMLNTKFTYSMLMGVNASRTILSGANLSGADLSNADLSGANLSGADLSNTILFGANLSGADLSNTKIADTNFHCSFIIEFENPSRTEIMLRKNTEIQMKNKYLMSGYMVPKELDYEDSILQDLKERNTSYTEQPAKSFGRRITKYTSDGKPIKNNNA